MFFLLGSCNLTFIYAFYLAVPVPPLDHRREILRYYISAWNCTALITSPNEFDWNVMFSLCLSVYLFVLRYVCNCLIALLTSCIVTSWSFINIKRCPRARLHYIFKGQRFYFSISETLGASRLFMKAKMNCLLPVIRFFVVKPRMFTFSLEYVENVRGLLLLQPQKHIKIVNPAWG